VSGEGQGRDRVGAAAAHNSSSSLPVQGGGAAYAHASALEMGESPSIAMRGESAVKAAALRDGERAGAGPRCVRTAPADGGDFRWARASSPGIGGDDHALAGGSGGIGRGDWLSVFTFLAREREAGITRARQANDAIAGSHGLGQIDPKNYSTLVLFFLVVYVEIRCSLVR
jgi:hypothetical protein